MALLNCNYLSSVDSSRNRNPKPKQRTKPKKWGLNNYGRAGYTGFQDYPTI